MIPVLVADMVLLVILLIINNRNQINHNVLPDSYVSGDYFDVKKVDRLVYFVTGRGLEIYLLRDNGIKLLSKISTDGLAYGLDVSGTYAYIADYYNGLCVMDISNPFLPHQVSHTKTDGNSSDVVIKGDYAYVADGLNGFIIFDISNPILPKLVGHCTIKGNAFSVTVKDTIAYVGSFNSPLKIINIADPFRPLIIGKFPQSSNTCGRDIFVDDTLAYVNCYFSHNNKDIRFAVINIKDPANPVFVTGLSLPPTNRGIIKFGDHVFVNAQAEGTYIINVKDPTRVSVVGKYDETTWFGYGYDIIDDHFLLVPQSSYGFSIVDVRKTCEPLTLYHYENITWKYLTLDDKHNYLYIIGHIANKYYFENSILKIVDIGNHKNPVVCGEFTFTGRGCLYEGSIDYPHLAITVYRGHPSNESLYTALLNISNPQNPKLVNLAKGGGVIELQYPYLYCLEGAVLKIADLHDSLLWTDSLVLANEGYDFIIEDTVVYATVKDSLVIYGLHSQKHLGACYHGKPYAVNISLNFPYLAVAYTPNPGNTYGFLIFEVSDPYLPVLMFDTLVQETAIDPMTICIVGCLLKDSLLFLGRGHCGFDIWQLEQNTIQRVLTQETPHMATHGYPIGNSNIYVKDKIIYVLDYGSLEMYTITHQ